jgi:hypothetical protein
MHRPTCFLLILIATFFSFGLLLAGCSVEKDKSGSFPMASLDQMPAYVKNSPSTVQQAYQFAVANPAVLEDIPCYCGCGAMGHSSNFACYVAERHQNGEIVYDPHAIGCSICVDITLDTMRLLKEGKNVSEIREYVDLTYSRYGPPTPP